MYHSYVSLVLHGADAGVVVASLRTFNITCAVYFFSSFRRVFFFISWNKSRQYTTNTDTGTGMQCELSAFFSLFILVYRSVFFRLVYSLFSFYLNHWAWLLLMLASICVLCVCVCLCEWYFFYRERISTWFFFLSWLAIIGFYSIFCTNMSSAFFIQGWKLHRNNAFKYASDKMIICSGKLGSSTGWSKKMRNFCFGRFSFLNVWCGVAFCLFRKHVWIHGMPLRS